MFGYELYLTSGLYNYIIDSDKNKTYQQHVKENASRLVTSNSGTALISSKLSVRNNKIGELGLSWMGGIYNKFKKDGVIIDNKRRCDVLDINFNTTLPKLNTNITTEWAWVFVQLPNGFNEQFGKKQQAGFIDVVQPILHKKMFGWDNATLNVAIRGEYADWNVARFTSTGKNIADDLWSIMPAISFRPNAETVLRLNYRYRKQRDLIGNPPATTNGFSFGISSYF